MPFYRRNDLRAVAQGKLTDAQFLLGHGRWSNAYYLGGFAIEIGLKACIAKQMSADVIPDKKFVNDIHSHQLRSLVGLAGLTQDLQAREQAEPAFAENWALVAQWSVEKRYEAVDQMSAQLLLAAISNEDAGVFPWIQIY